MKAPFGADSAYHAGESPARPDLSLSDPFHSSAATADFLQNHAEPNLRFGETHNPKLGNALDPSPISGNWPFIHKILATMVGYALRIHDFRVCQIRPYSKAKTDQPPSSVRPLDHPIEMLAAVRHCMPQHHARSGTLRARV
ncbi:MAG: hypothetical protein KF805_11675 [Phycisphaeraceae bacterium]|nr:hypothetical protein [Phycisphaeraceae bacterium]